MTELKNTERELHLFRLRLSVAGFVVFVLFGCLLARFIWLQVYKHNDYVAQAEDNRISVVPVVPNRGLIVDRNGVVLARNYSAYTLEITPSKINGDLETLIDEQAHDQLHQLRSQQQQENVQGLRAIREPQYAPMDHDREIR